MDRLLFLAAGMIIGAALAKGALRRKELESENAALRKPATA